MKNNRGKIKQSKAMDGFEDQNKELVLLIGTQWQPGERCGQSNKREFLAVKLCLGVIMQCQKGDGNN